MDQRIDGTVIKLRFLLIGIEISLSLHEYPLSLRFTGVVKH